MKKFSTKLTGYYHHYNFLFNINIKTYNNIMNVDKGYVEAAIPEGIDLREEIIKLKKEKNALGIFQNSYF